MAIVLKTISDSREAQADLAKLRKSVDSIKTSTEQVSSNFGKMARVLALGASAFIGIKAITGMSDKITVLNNKLRVATESEDEFNYALNQTRKIALENRTGLQDVGTLYSKLSRATKAFGATQFEVATVTDTVTKALRLSGATAAEASSAVLQFGQAMSSQLLAGDELRSLRENAPVLLEAIARGLKVDVGMLKEMGEKGLLPSIKVFKALLAEAKNVGAETGKLNVTYAEAFTNIRNSLSILWAETKESFTKMGDLFARTLNNIALSIAHFAMNLDIRLLMWKSKFLVFAYSIKEFFTVVFAKGKALLAPFERTIERIEDKVRSLFGMTKNISIDAAVIDVDSPFANLDDAVVTVKDFAKKAEEPFAQLYDAVIGNSWIPDLVKGVETVLGYLLRKPLMIINDFVKASNTSFSKMSFFAPLALGLVLLIKYKSMMIRLISLAALFAATVSGIRWFKARKEKKQDFSVLKGQELNYNVFGKDSFTKKNPFLTDNNPVVKTADKLGQDFSVQLYKSSELNNDLLRKNNKTLNEKLSENIKAVKEKTNIVPLKDKIKGRLNFGYEGFKTEWQRFKDNFNDSKFGESFNYSAFGRTIKQVLGVRDRFSGNIMGQEIDTLAYVGRGPQRKLPDRSFGHDIINALPKNIQTPFVVSLAALIGYAILKAFKDGPVRTGLLGLLLAGFTVVSQKTIDKSTYREGLAKPVFNVAKFVNDKFLKPVYGREVEKEETLKKKPVFKRVTNDILDFLANFQNGLKNLLSNNAWGNGGTILTNGLDFLSLIAKLALLFKGGRKFLGGIATSALNLPNNIAMNISNRADLRAIDRRIEQDQPLLTAQQRLAHGTAPGDERRFSRQQLDAADALHQQRAAALGPVRQAENEERARASQRRMDLNKGIRDKLQGSIVDSRMLLRNSVIQTGSGIGAVLGGAAAFQIGMKIAEGMEGAPAWQKVGVTIATAVAGESIGSGIGTALGWAFVAIMQASMPIIMVAAAFAAGLIIGQAIKDAAVAAWDYIKKLKSGEISEEEGHKKVSETFAPTNKILGPVGSLSKFTELAGHGVTNYYGTSENSKKATEEGIEKSLGETLKQEFADPVKNFFLPEPESIKRLEQLFNPISSAKASELGKPTAKELTEKTSDKSLENPLTEVEITAERVETKLEEAQVSFGENFKAFFNGLMAILTNAEMTLQQKASSSIQLGNETLFQPFVTKFFPTLGSEKEKDKVKNPLDNMSWKERYEIADDATFAKYQANLTAQIESAGIKNLKPEELDELGPDFQVQALTIMDNIDKLMQMNTEGAAASAEGLRDDLNKILRERVTNLQMEGKVSSNVEVSGEGGLNFGDAFELIGTTMEELGLTFESFKKLGPDIRLALMKTAIDINAANTALSDVGYNSEKTGELIEAAREKLEKGLKTSWELLKGKRPGFEDFSARAIKAEVDFGQPAYNVLTNTEETRTITLFDELAKQIENQKDDTKRETAQFEIVRLLKEVEKIRIAAERRAANDNIALLQQNFEDVGLTLERLTYFNMSDDKRSEIQDKVAAIKSNNEALEIETDPEIQKRYAKANAEMLTGLKEELEELSPFYKKTSQVLGESFVMSMKEGFSSSVKDFLKGKSSFGEMMKNIGMRFVDSVVDTFVESMVDRLFFKKEFVDKSFKAIGENIGKLFEEGGGIQKILESIGILKPKTTEKLDTKTNFGDVYESQKAPLAASIGSALAVPFERPAFEPNYEVFESPTMPGLPEISAPFTEPQLPLSRFESTPFSGMTDPITQTAETMTSGISNENMMKPVVEKLDAQNKLTETGTKVTKDGLTGTEAAAVAGTAIAGMAMMSSDDNFTKMLGVLTMVLGAVQLAAVTGAFAEGGKISGPGTGTSDSILARVSKGEYVVNARATKENFKILEAINSGKNLKKFATGGAISGPGTGTSDSILARVSKGEYIVNAKATKENLKILETINSGEDLKKFATGGLISPVLTTTPTLTNIQPPNVNNQQSNSQTINITVTGDISRQTKAELFRMLPTIAEGVNSHNREKGYKQA